MPSNAMSSPNEDSSPAACFDDDELGPIPSIEDVSTGRVITAADAAPSVSQEDANSCDFDALGPQPFVVLLGQWRAYG